MKSIDNRMLVAGGWGEAPFPLVPRRVRGALGAVRLPRWVADELRLPEGATVAALDSSIWQRIGGTSDRVLNSLCLLVRNHLRDVAPVHCGDADVFPVGVALTSAPLSARSRNALAAAGLLDRPRQLAELTFGDLLRLPAVGIRSALEIACVLEVAVDAQLGSLNQLPVSAGPSEAADWVKALTEVGGEGWADQVSEQDPRFQGLLPSGSGTVQDRVERCLAEPGSGLAAVEGKELAAALPSIRARVDQISRLKLDDALRDFLAALTKRSESQFSALWARFGWNGDGPITLEEVARPLGVTRERIRQIETKVRTRLPTHAVFMPQLDRALSVVEEAAPIPVERAAVLLQDAGVATVPFSINALINAANMLGRATGLSFEELPQGRIILARPLAGTARYAAKVARRLAGRAGVASVFQVAAEMGGASAPLEPDEVRRLLQDLSGFEFLNEDWFWATDLPVRRNRLSNVTKKILSVASPQSVVSIREGVRRAYTYRSKSNPRYESLTTPPGNVLSAFYTRSPEFRIDGELVSATTPLDPKEELGEIDLALVGVLRGAPTGVLDRKSLVEICLKQGLNESTVQTFLTYSPIIEHASLDAWKLRGVHVDPAAVEALREANQLAPRERRILSFGWNTAGNLWIASKLPYSIASVVIGIPGTLKRYLLERSFHAVEKATGRPCGQVTINSQGSSFGYFPFLRRAGADAGDVLLAEFDLAKETVFLSLEGESALEDDAPSPGAEAASSTGREEERTTPVTASAGESRAAL